MKSVVWEQIPPFLVLARVVSTAPTTKTCSIYIPFTSSLLIFYSFYVLDPSFRRFFTLVLRDNYHSGPTA